jgi:hypothetical protein
VREINRLVPGGSFTDATVRTIAMDAVSEKEANVDPPPPFDCSPRFIMGFKNCDQFSSGRANLKGRLRVMEEKRQRWIQTLIKLMENVAHHSRIITVNELYWGISQRALRTGAKTGSQNVHVSLNDSEKD